MDLETILFYFFMGLTCLSVLYIAWTKNILYAAFALMLTFLGMAGLFVFLGAEFLAITQIVVYVGGILILIIFGMMLTNKLSDKKLVTQRYQLGIGVLIAIGLGYVLIRLIANGAFRNLVWMDRSHTTTAGLKALGMQLMTQYVLAFEIIGLLLLIALIGALYIAGKVRKEESHAA